MKDRHGESDVEPGAERETQGMLVTVGGDEVDDEGNGKSRKPEVNPLSGEEREGTRGRLVIVRLTQQGVPGGGHACARNLSRVRVDGARRGRTS